jgi:hypothetical protein
MCTAKTETDDDPDRARYVAIITDGKQTLGTEFRERRHRFGGQ